MDWRQKLIDEKYSGDATRFEVDWADAILEGRLHTVSWDDLIIDATVLADLKETGRDLIEKYLGYLPGESTTLPYEPYLRALIQHYRQNQISGSDFTKQVEDHMKLIRNEDMRYNTCLTYDEAIYENYRLTFAPFDYAVRERLTRFLGYEPQLKHSLVAEMWFRDILSDQTYKLPDEITPDDIRAITLIKYREVLLEQGKNAADASPLVSIEQ